MKPGRFWRTVLVLFCLSVAISCPGAFAAPDDVSAAGSRPSSTEVWGFLDGLAGGAGVHETTAFGRDLSTDLILTLRHAESGALVPVEIVDAVGNDSLMISIDLSDAARGRYDLDVETLDEEHLTTASILFLGTYETIIVPDQVPTIAEAIATAEPCTEILVTSGTYEECLVIDKPLRLRSLHGWRETVIRPGGEWERVIHVLPEAGPLTEIVGFWIEGGRVNYGPGGGILCEAPALIRENLLYDNRVGGAGGLGGAIYASGGCRIISNRISTNRAGGDPGWWNPWSTASSVGGVAGGVYCLNCLVAHNDFYENGAESCSAFVVDGIFRGNRIEEHWPNSYIPIGLGAGRGEIIGNDFDQRCAGGAPILVFDGPSIVARNTFFHIAWDLCDGYAGICLRGSVDFYQNSDYGQDITGLLMTHRDEPASGHFRMYNNIFATGPVDLLRDHDSDICRSVEPIEEYVPIPADSLSLNCNLGYAEQIRFRQGSHWVECDTCSFAGDIGFCAVQWENVWDDDDLRISTLSEALPQNSPVGCPDTLGALGIGCGPNPILLSSWGIEPVKEGARLFWSLPLDVSVAGFEIEREAAGHLDRLTDEPLPPCRECEYIDRAVPVDRPIVYRLGILLSNGERETVELGSWTGAASLVGDVMLRQPAPNPARGVTRFAFALPRSEAEVKLEVYDVAGRRVATAYAGPAQAGWRQIEWTPRGDDGRLLAPGLYLARLRSSQGSATQRLLLLR